jgi:autotransporter-associated beta strand protein
MKHSPSSLSICRHWFVLLAVIIQPGLVHAATLTWSGTTNNLWSVGGAGGNWTNAIAPVNGDNLVFAGTTNTSTSNDLTGLTLGGTNAISFTNDTGTNGFTLAGNQITLGGNINSTGTTGTHVHVISLDMVMNGNRSVNPVTGTTISISGAISETGGARTFTKLGAGALTLTGVNTFTGAMIIQGSGTVNFNSLADSGVASSLGAGSAITLGSGSAVTMNYNGTAAASSDRTLNITPTAAGQTITISNSAGAGNSLAFTGLLNNTGAFTRTLALSGSNTDNNVLASAIADATGGVFTLVKNGTGNWALTSTSSTYTGASNVNQGTLRIMTIEDYGVASSLGAPTTGTIRLGNQGNSGVLEYAGSGSSSNRRFTIGSASTGASQAGGGTINNNGTGALILTAPTFNTAVDVTQTTSGGRSLTLGGTYTDGTNAIEGVIQNNSTTGQTAGTPVSVIKTGAALWTLSGDNTYTGGTTVNSGTLNINNAGSSAGSSAIGTGALTLSGGARIDNTSGAAITLSTANAVAINGPFTFGGTDDLSFANGTATFNGNRVITLQGTNRTLTLGPTTHTNTGPSTLTVNQGIGSGGTLMLGALNLSNSATNRVVTIAGSGLVNIPGVIANGGTSTAGSLVYAGTGTLTLGGANTYGGTTTINSGTVKLSADEVIPNTSALTITGGTLDLNGRNETLGALLTFGATTTTVAGTTTFLSDSASGGLLTLNAGLQTQQGSAGFHNGQATISANIDLGGANRTFTIRDSDQAVNDAVFTGVISGTSAGIIKSGGGRLVLSGSNTFDGAVSFGATNNGTILVTHANGLGSTAAGTSVTSGSALELSGGITIGAETLSLTGSGVGAGGALRSVSGANTYGGDVTLTGNATITTAADSLTISGGIARDSGNRTLTLDGAGNLTVSGVIGDLGTGAVIKEGTGTATFSAGNTFSGPLTINAGQVALASGGTLSDQTAVSLASATASFDISAITAGGETVGSLAAVTGSSVNLGSKTLSAGQDNSSTTVAGIISGTGGSLVKEGSGTLTLTGANTHSGTTTVTAGALQVGSSGSGSTGTGAISVLTGGTILGTGIVAGASFTAQTGGIVHAGDGTAQGDYGTLSFTPVSGAGTFDFQSGSSTILGINPGGTSDLLNFVGNGSNSLIFNGNLTVGPVSFTPTMTETFNLLDWVGLVSSPTFDARFLASSYSGFLLGNGDDNLGFDLPDISSGAGYAWDIGAFTTNGSISIVLVPEPSRAVLLLVGSLLVWLRRRRI